MDKIDSLRSLTEEFELQTNSDSADTYSLHSGSVHSSETQYATYLICV